MQYFTNAQGVQKLFSITVSHVCIGIILTTLTVVMKLALIKSALTPKVAVVVAWFGPPPRPR